MPLYTYRREDGTTFDIRQGFSDEPLTVDPESGQQVVRVIQPAPIIFKGSGFYVNDSRGKTNSTLNTTKKPETDAAKAETGTSTTTEAPKSPPTSAPAAAD